MPLVGPDQFFPSWEVIAQRLNLDGTYDPRGEIIHFCADGDTEVRNVKIVRKMEMKFV